MTKKNIKYKIGCSGYYYESWRGIFYPEKLSLSKWLAYYSSVFNTVELNNSFYRTPTLSQLKRYADTTPDDFKFVVKMNRMVTHNKKLGNNSSGYIREFSEMVNEGLGHKLEKVLFQFPPSFSYNEKNLELVISIIPKGKTNAVEFRNISWWQEDVLKMMQKHGRTFCNVDYLDLPLTFLCTSSNFYLRLHGTPVLFASPYSKARLKRIAEQLPGNCDDFNIYFNNTDKGAAFRNAQELMKIINEQETRTRVENKSRLQMHGSRLNKRRRDLNGDHIDNKYTQR